MNVVKLLLGFAFFFANYSLAGNCPDEMNYWQNNSNIQADCFCPANMSSNFNLASGNFIGNCIRNSENNIVLTVGNNILYLWLDGNDRRGDGFPITNTVPFPSNHQLDFWQNKRSNSSSNRLINNNFNIFDGLDQVNSANGQYFPYKSVVFNDINATLKFFNNGESIASPSLSAVTIFVVFKLNNLADYNILTSVGKNNLVQFQVNNDGSLTFTYQNEILRSSPNLINSGTKYLISLNNNAGVKNIYLNGQFVVSRDDSSLNQVNTENWNNVSTQIGNFSGSIYEIIIYSSYLSNGQRNFVEQYLLQKWIN